MELGEVSGTHPETVLACVIRSPVRECPTSPEISAEDWCHSGEDVWALTGITSKMPLRAVKASITFESTLQPGTGHTTEASPGLLDSTLPNWRKGYEAHCSTQGACTDETLDLHLMCHRSPRCSARPMFWHRRLSHLPTDWRPRRSREQSCFCRAAGESALHAGERTAAVRDAAGSGSIRQRN
jgi:hypothetical protein